ncbi:aryl-alcohol dehydrogenase [NADP(+)] [Irpex rosettiformis]|uniref:Aryl-alcohol dehydrogenase [NADP(+)] n=1 Tax=Irpex rosettiformis TaxID=378272 RepID=A0ACB8UBA0_9APHY|nr:aryl-alcohol dehydrogenase [NADP(+)] [Irpex rosettiformis]
MSTLMVPPPEPATKLGRHRQLSPLAGIHVSPLALGAMSIGEKWGEYGIAGTDKEASFKLLDAFYEAGGNFIDTANNYQDEASEEYIGEWIEKRGIRDQIVVATKYTTNYKRGADLKQKTTYSGNNTKSLHLSVEASLKKLRTDYIDILYLHWWDYTTSVEEVMNSLHNLVAQGKVLYLGVSDTPAWVVSKANTYAKMAGKTPFVIYQGAWNILLRDIERDIIPMCVQEGLAIAPWNVLGAGKLRTDAEEERRRQTGEGGRGGSGSWERNETERKMSHALEKVAGEVGAKSITAVAIAYIQQKVPYVFPIIGGRKVEHLQANLEALDISLSKEQVAYLESIVPWDKGFPFNYFGDGSDYNIFAKTAGHFDRWPRAEPIRPQKD